MNLSVPKPIPGHVMAGTRRSIIRHLAATGLLACCAATIGRAQNPALSRAAYAAPVVAYTANESGGRITMADPRGDSLGVETIRLHLSGDTGVPTFQRIIFGAFLVFLAVVIGKGSRSWVMQHYYFVNRDKDIGVFP